MESLLEGLSQDQLIRLSQLAATAAARSSGETTGRSDPSFPGVGTKESEESNVGNQAAGAAWSPVDANNGNATPNREPQQEEQELYEESPNREPQQEEQELYEESQEEETIIPAYKEVHINLLEKYDVSRVDDLIGKDVEKDDIQDLISTLVWYEHSCFLKYSRVYQEGMKKYACVSCGVCYEWRTASSARYTLLSVPQHAENCLPSSFLYETGDASENSGRRAGIILRNLPVVASMLSLYVSSSNTSKSALLEITRQSSPRLSHIPKSSFNDSLNILHHKAHMKQRSLFSWTGG
jgi:hypothetical protein